MAPKKPIYIYIIYISLIRYWNWVQINMKLAKKIQYKNSIAQCNLITVQQLCAVYNLIITYY